MLRSARFSFFLVALVGLSACSARGKVPGSVVLDDFERVPDPGLLQNRFDPVEALKHPTYPSHDFDVATSGYASVTSLSRQSARDARDRALYEFIQGKSAAQVRFTVPGDYHKAGEDGFPTTWESGFGLTTDSHTPLKVTDWSPYAYFDFRVYNPRPLAQTLYVRYSDAASNVTVTSVTLPQGESEVELPLAQLSAARLDPADMKGVMLYLDTAGQQVDPVLMFDQLALYEADAATRFKLAQDEGASDQSDEEDWDEQDSDTVRKVRVIHPGEAPAPAPQSVRGPAAAR